MVLGKVRIPEPPGHRLFACRVGQGGLCGKATTSDFGDAVAAAHSQVEFVLRVREGMTLLFRRFKNTFTRAKGLTVRVLFPRVQTESLCNLRLDGQVQRQNEKNAINNDC